MENLWNWITLAITILLGFPSAVKGYTYLLKSLRGDGQAEREKIKIGPTKAV